MKYKRNVDLTGRRYGSLVVLYRAEDKVSVNGCVDKQWYCQCDCQKYTVVRESNLKSGHTKSCGCQKYSGLTQRLDLTGQTINGILVLAMSNDEVQNDGSHIVKWLCQCHCGKLFVTRGTALTSGHTKSCGCRKKQLRIKDEEMIGRRFNKLTVVSRGQDEITPRGLRYVRWNRLCECGRLTLVRGTALRNGAAVSCGCTRADILQWHMSNGERWIAEYLDDCGYAYERQKYYIDLISDCGKYLYYDFLVYLSNNRKMLIECQGRQHYEHIDYFGDTDSFMRLQKRDELKRIYAKFIGVPLIEIDYSITTKKKCYESTYSKI